MKLLAIAASTILVFGLGTTAYAGASTELEHAIKTPTNVESPAEDMSAMKAAGKCGAGQSTTGRTFKKSVKGTSASELEHAIRPLQVQIVPARICLR